MGTTGPDVECFDYSTERGCANFPKTFSELDYLYTVNPDPQRPTCIWVNSDNGAHQIQNFDAYTGEACGRGTIRVLASQFVVPSPQCTPASYVSLQVLQPARAPYTSGSIAFDDGDGNPIPGLRLNCRSTARDGEPGRPVAEHSDRSAAIPVHAEWRERGSRLGRSQAHLDGQLQRDLHRRRHDRCETGSCDAHLHTSGDPETESLGWGGCVRRGSPSKRTPCVCGQQRICRLGERQADRIGHVHGQRTQGGDVEAGQLPRPLHGAHQGATGSQ